VYRCALCDALVDIVEVQGGVDETVRDVDEIDIVIAGVRAHPRERAFDVETRAFRDDAFGLFPDDPVVEGRTECSVHELSLPRADPATFGSFAAHNVAIAAFIALSRRR
jgi:hypothetical protein